MPAQPVAAPEPEPVEEIDLLGLPKPGRTRTKNDILKLFDKKEEKEKCLLAGDVFDNLVDIAPSQEEQQLQPATMMADYYSASAVPVAMQPSPFFGQQHQVELNQMQHQPPPEIREEPAAATDQYADNIESTSVQLHQSNPIPIPERGGGPGMGGDAEFDAFSSRFESVGKEDTLMVETDPFDPFSAGGSARGSGKPFKDPRLMHSFISPTYHDLITILF
jgi:hypothetical protein